MRALLVLGLTGLLCSNAFAADAPKPARHYGVRLIAEGGFLAVASHTLKLSRDGSNIDYVTEGGQDVLFAFGRLSANVRFLHHHNLVLLWQPLTVETQVVLKRDLRIDGLDFPAGTPTRMLYNFPFWRLSYFYDFFPGTRHEIAIGGGMQIRDATIEFASLDGKLLRSSRGIGPVPLLSVRGHYGFQNGLWIGGEVEGFYAPVSILNGSKEEITGAIVDASVRFGLTLPYGINAFLNLRYLGGGAVGGGEDDDEPGDGYVKNWLHFITVSLGVSVDLF